MTKKAIVAGSIALDIVMKLPDVNPGQIQSIFSQGKITNLSGVHMYLGGETGNTGLAMSKMGIPVTVACKIGHDHPGKMIQEIFSEYDLDSRIKIADHANSTVAISVTPPGMDKISFLYKGAGQTFMWEDVPADSLASADLFHFGYPTAMDHLFADEGSEFLKIFSEAKKFGITTSVDTTLPDLNSPAGQVHWKSILEKVLPFVDIFVPSIEETLFMLDRDQYIREVERVGGGNMVDHIDPNQVAEIGSSLIAMGPKIVLIKMGKQGLYLKTADKNSFTSFGRAAPVKFDDWYDRELWDPALDTEPIRSTTGAGDTAIAGFLSAFLQGEKPERALEIASMAASLCISSYDTVSKIGKLSEIKALLDQKPGHPRLPVSLNPENWQKSRDFPIFHSRQDHQIDC